jgi:lipopolysaccharide transport system ATP-binding protein
MSPVIRVENLSKYYRLGLIGGGTLHEDLNRWWAKVRGRPDPLLRIGETDHGNRKDGQLWALRDVNLEVKEGEILGIIGRNGAGKSTLLKILSRITAPTDGRVKIRGRVGSLLEVGTGFHHELTGRENIYLNGTILGMTRAEVDRKLDEIIDFAEIAQFIDTPVKRYSSGMTVRLAFAVAAHLEPEILIIDEVLAVGDAAFQKKCLGKMQDVSAHGRTVLFVSHNMGSINRLCTRCVQLWQGKVADYGEVSDVTRRYLDEATPEQGARRWNQEKEPGSERCRLHEVAVHQGGRPNATATVSIKEPIDFMIDLTIEVQSDELAIGIIIANYEGTAVF